MKRLQLLVELEYDDDIMHGDDSEAQDWFWYEVLRGQDLILYDNGEIGDEIGKVSVKGLITDREVREVV